MIVATVLAAALANAASLVQGPASRPCALVSGKGQDAGFPTENGERVKYVLCYQSATDVAQKAPAYAAAHRAHWKEFLSDGSLLMIGPFANPAEGAMAVFTTREAAESFAKSDPFVLNGVVENWLVREWMEAIVPE